MFFCGTLTRKLPLTGALCQTASSFDNMAKDLNAVAFLPFQQVPLFFSLDPQWRIVVPQCFMKKKRSDIGGGKCRPLISAAQVELQVHCEPDVHRRCQNYSDGTPVYTLHTHSPRCFFHLKKQGAPHQKCLY